MKNVLLAFITGGLFIGTAVFAASRRAQPIIPPKSPVAAPGGKTDAPPPRGDAPVPPGDELARMKAENDSLKKQIADLEAKKADPKGSNADPLTQMYSGTKLMDDALKQKLALTPDQETKMRDAILKFLKDSQAVWARTDLNFQQKEAEIERLKLALEPEFQAILSGQQYTEMMAARTDKKTKAREAAIGSESKGYNQFLGLDDTQQKQMEGIVRGYYDANPTQKPGYKWMYDQNVRDQIQAILKTTDQIEKFTKNIKGLDSARK